jgi:hypothetical protein
MLALGIVFALVGPAQGATIYVPDDYPAIQDAINASMNGDTIIVRPGTFHESIDFLGKSIALRSEKGPELTVINGGGLRVVTFQSSEDANTVLDGFTITNGDGGIFTDGSNTMPLITNNIITGNSASWGGAIYCRSGSLPTITGNVLSFNSGLWGGAIYCNGSGVNPMITNNLIHGNSGTYGGGITNNNYGSPIVIGNVIYDNTATYGSGIFCEYSVCYIVNNTITGNASTSSGGGVYVHKDSLVSIANTVIWDNTAPTGPELAVAYTLSKPATCNVDYSDLKGGQAAVFVDPSCTLNWGVGNIDADPLFADPAMDDYHLNFPSPCRDAGDNSSVIGTEDFEGDLRIANGVVDMGADEFYQHLYHLGTVIPGQGIEIKVTGAPGAAPVTLALGSGVQDPPQPTPYGDLHLVLPPIFKANLGAIPASGVLAYPATVPLFWSAGDQHPLQALIGPLGNPGSVLTNLLVLTVE